MVVAVTQRLNDEFFCHYKLFVIRRYDLNQQDSGLCIANQVLTGKLCLEMVIIF